MINNFSEIDTDNNRYLTRDEIDKAIKTGKAKEGELYVSMTLKDLLNGTTREQKLQKAEAYFGNKSNTYYGVGDEPMGAYNASYKEDEYMLIVYTQACLKSEGMMDFGDKWGNVSKKYMDYLVNAAEAIEDKGRKIYEFFTSPFKRN